MCEDQLIVVKITQVTVILPQVIVVSHSSLSSRGHLATRFGEVSHRSLSLKGHSASKLQLRIVAVSACEMYYIVLKQLFGASLVTLDKMSNYT